MMGQAERVAAAEDAEHGVDHRGGDLQREMATRNSRLSKIRKAKHDLEQHARDQGAQHARTKARNAGHPSDVAEEAAGRAAETATPKATAQRRSRSGANAPHTEGKRWTSTGSRKPSPPAEHAG